MIMLSDSLSTFLSRQGCPAILAALVLVTGCRPMPTRQAPPPATLPSTQKVQATPDTSVPWEANVTQIITKPKIATPATTQAGSGLSRTTGITQAVPTPKFSLDDLKRVDTSVATAPLVRLLAMKLNGIPYSRFAGYGAIDFTPNLPEGTQPDKMTNDILTREPSGSTKAIARVAGGEIDMAFVSRAPTEAEIQAADKKGVKLRNDKLATEALVFMVNRDNPVNGMTRDQLATIFTGQAKKWADLKIAKFPLNHPIANQPITVAYRARGLGTEELMSQLLLKGQPMPEMPVSKALASTKLVLDATNEDPETIGFSVFVYANNMQRDTRIKVLSIDGVLPEPGRVASGEYPLTTPIYLVSRQNLEPNSSLAGLRRWLLDMPGQQLLAEAGYMPTMPQAWTEQRLMGTGAPTPPSAPAPGK
jgi:phosphate transport system substrate-binding protein